MQALSAIAVETPIIASKCTFDNSKRIVGGRDDRPWLKAIPLSMHDDEGMA